jgi:hypothetical protein
MIFETLTEDCGTVRIGFYRGLILDHARKLGYCEPDLIEQHYWRFRHPCGAVVYALYDVPCGLTVSLQSHLRQAKRNLTIRCDILRNKDQPAADCG